MEMEIQSHVNETSPANTTSTATNDSTTDVSHNVSASNFKLENYIIIGTAGLFVGIILIAIIILLTRKIRDRCCVDSRLLEAYASINYDEESLDTELDDCDDLAYTSCKLYVGSDLGIDSDFTNSEPEYDCMSVDVTVSANEPPIVDRNTRGRARSCVKEEGMTQSLKTLPHTFWKR